MKSKELVSNENMALGEALDKVHETDYRLGKQQRKLEEDQQALETWLTKQQAINATMCRRLSETTESPTTQPWLPRDANPQQVWSFVPQLINGLKLYGASWALAGPLVREEQAKNWHKVQGKLQVMQKQQFSGDERMQLCLLMVLLKGVNFNSSTLLVGSSSLERAGHVQPKLWTRQRIGQEGARRQEQGALHTTNQRQTEKAWEDGVGEVPVINLTDSPSKTSLPEDSGLVHKTEAKLNAD